MQREPATKNYRKNNKTKRLRGILFHAHGFCIMRRMMPV